MPLMMAVRISSRFEMATSSSTSFTLALIEDGTLFFRPFGRPGPPRLRPDMFRAIAFTAPVLTPRPEPRRHKHDRRNLRARHRSIPLELPPVNHGARPNRTTGRPPPH